MTDTLDFRTLTVATGAVVLALSGAMLHVRFTRHTYPGFNLWVLGSLCAAGSMLQEWAWGGRPSPAGAVLGNAMASLALALITVGLEAFLGRGRRTWPHALAVAATLGSSALFTWGAPSVPARVASGELVYAAQVAWALWLVIRGVAPLLGAHNRLLEVVLAVQGAWSVARVGLLIAGDAVPSDLLSDAAAQSVSFVVFPAVTAVLVYGLTDLNLQRLESDLRSSLEEIRTLRGIIPICAYCKQIRDDRGSWQQVEAYVSEHTDAEFSHGICPRCMEERYPEVE